MGEQNAKQVREYFINVIDDNSSQKELARIIGVSEASISRFINGEIGPGEKILDYLGFERVFRYRPTQNPLPHELSNVIPQSEIGKGGGRPLVDEPDSSY